jgi:hypothetical protein
MIKRWIPTKYKNLFTFFCWGFAFPAAILGTLLTDNIFMFLAGAGICFVGVASLFKDKTAKIVHNLAAIVGLSKRENVFVKLGALPIRMPSYEGDRSLPPGSEEVAAAWQPWMETCIEAFSPARSMYESNFPVQKRWCSYQVCWNAFKRISAGASAAEKTDLFAAAAARAYRMKNVL